MTLLNKRSGPTAVGLFLFVFVSSKSFLHAPKVLIMTINNNILNGVGTIYELTDYVHDVKERTTDSLKEAFVFGKDVYGNIYTDQWPKASKTAGVTLGLVVFIGKTYYDYLTTAVKLDFKLLTAATVYAFTKEDLIPDRPTTTLQFIKPRRPAYLVWEKSRDGTYSVVYNITPLPGIILDGTQRFSFIQRGGKKDKKSDDDLNSLAKAMEKGYTKNTIPSEMQDYLKKKMIFVKTDAVKSGLEDVDDFSHENDVMILSVAEEEAFFKEDVEDESLLLVCPLPPLEKEAMENAKFVIDVIDPAAEGAVEPKREDVLPSPVPETPKPEPKLEVDKDIPKLPVSIPFTILTRKARRPKSRSKSRGRTMYKRSNSRRKSPYKRRSNSFRKSPYKRRSNSFRKSRH